MLSSSVHQKNTYLRRSSSRSKQNIGQRVVSIWHDRWHYLSHHSSQHPICPNLLSVCLAMSSLVFQPSSCHLLVSILSPEWLVWLSGVAECDQTNRLLLFATVSCSASCSDRAITSPFMTWSRH